MDLIGLARSEVSYSDIESIASSYQGTRVNPLQQYNIPRFQVAMMW